MRFVTAFAMTAAIGSMVVLGAAPAEASADASTPACTRIAEDKPAGEPVLRVTSSGLVVKLPADSAVCDRVVRLADQDGKELLLPVTASARRVMATARPGATYIADFKVVASGGESGWSKLSAMLQVPASAAGLHAVAALRVATQRGGVLVSWGQPEPAASVARYRVKIRCSGTTVLKATVAPMVTSLWGPVEPASACRAEVAAIGADGRVGAVSGIDVTGD